MRVTPQSNDFSYGIRIFSEWLASVGRKIGGSAVGKLPLRAWDDGVAALIVAAALFAVQKGRIRLPRANGAAAQRDLDLFVAGAGVYVCSYVLLRNFDYRLAYLLLTLPQLLRWAREGQRLAVVSLVALFGTLWFDADLTVDVPLLGSAMRHWNKFTTDGAPSGTLPAAVADCACSCCSPDSLPASAGTPSHPSFEGWEGSQGLRCGAPASARAPAEGRRPAPSRAHGGVAFVAGHGEPAHSPRGGPQAGTGKLQRRSWSSRGCLRALFALSDPQAPRYTNG